MAALPDGVPRARGTAAGLPVALPCNLWLVVSCSRSREEARCDTLGRSTSCFFVRTHVYEPLPLRTRLARGGGMPSGHLHKTRKSKFCSSMGWHAKQANNSAARQPHASTNAPVRLTPSVRRLR